MQQEILIQIADGRVMRFTDSGTCSGSHLAVTMWKGTDEIGGYDLTQAQFDKSIADARKLGTEITRAQWDEIRRT